MVDTQYAPKFWPKAYGPLNLATSQWLKGQNRKNVVRNRYMVNVYVPFTVNVFRPGNAGRLPNF